MSIDWDAVVIGPLHGIFGEPMMYMPLAGGSFPISGIFDNAYLKEVMFEDASTGVTEVSACVGVRLSELPADPVQNDQLFIPANPRLYRAAATYVVRQPRPDSRGGFRLLLSKVSSS